MLVVHVHVHVRPDDIGDFLDATRQNARASLTEPGALRFDVVQDEADLATSCWSRSTGTARPLPRTRRPSTTPDGGTPSRSSWHVRASR